MKNVILSADGAPSVYSVPDVVADNLEKYCIEFDHWLGSPGSEDFCTRLKDDAWLEDCIFFDERSFILYLNQRLFPDEPSVLIERLERVDTDDDLPEQYRQCPWFNF